MTLRDMAEGDSIPSTERKRYYLFCLECYAEMVVGGEISIDRLAKHRATLCQEECEGDVRHVVTTDMEVKTPCSRCGETGTPGHEIGSSSYCLPCAAEIWENIGGVTHE